MKEKNSATAVISAYTSTLHHSENTNTENRDRKDDTWNAFRNEHSYTSNKIKENDFRVVGDISESQYSVQT